MRSSKRVEPWSQDENSSLYLQLCHVCSALNESSHEIHECIKCQAVFTIDAPAAITRTIGTSAQEWDEDFSEGELPEGYEQMAEEVMEEEQAQKDFHHDPLPFGRKKTAPLTGLKVHW